MPVDAVFEIGSVTKQFTAAAVLQLRDQGKLDLDADLSRYPPGFDTQGHRIPVRRLLDHTSGMKGARAVSVRDGQLRPRPGEVGFGVAGVLNDLHGLAHDALRSSHLIDRGEQHPCGPFGLLTREPLHRPPHTLIVATSSSRTGSRNSLALWRWLWRTLRILPSAVRRRVRPGTLSHTFQMPQSPPALPPATDKPMVSPASSVTPAPVTRIARRRRRPNWPP